MAALKNFMENNVGYIIAIVALFISLMTLFTFLGVDFNPHGKEHIEKIVTIEGMLASLDDNEESTVPQTPGITQPTTNNPKPVQLEDSSEMTGSSSMVTTSTNQAKELQEKKRKRNRIKRMLKATDASFTQSLADKKGTSCHCHPRFSKVKDSERHCNRISNKLNCDIHNCCVWLVHDKGPQCVTGGPNGPVYHTRNGKPIDSSKYFYQGNCHGEGC